MLGEGEKHQEKSEHRLEELGLPKNWYPLPWLSKHPAKGLHTLVQNPVPAEGPHGPFCLGKEVLSHLPLFLKVVTNIFFTHSLNLSRCHCDRHCNVAGTVFCSVRNGKRITALRLLFTGCKEQWVRELHSSTSSSELPLWVFPIEQNH